jgi:hypothetical protein
MTVTIGFAVLLGTVAAYIAYPRLAYGASGGSELQKHVINCRLEKSRGQIPNI